MTRAANVLFLFALLLHAEMWWRAIAWYSKLPAKIPIHFGIDGRPDRWAARGAEWFATPGIAFGLLVVLGGVAVMLRPIVRRMPRLVNVPQRELFRQLSSDGRVQVIAPMEIFLAWVLLLVQMMFLTSVEGSAAVAVGTSEKLGIWIPLVLVLGILAPLPLAVIRTRRLIVATAVAEVRAALERAESSETVSDTDPSSQRTQ